MSTYPLGVQPYGFGTAAYPQTQSQPLYGPTSYGWGQQVQPAFGAQDFLAAVLLQAIAQRMASIQQSIGQLETYRQASNTTPYYPQPQIRVVPPAHNYQYRVLPAAPVSHAPTAKSAQLKASAKAVSDNKTTGRVIKNWTPGMWCAAGVNTAWKQALPDIPAPSGDAWQWGGQLDALASQGKLREVPVNSIDDLPPGAIAWWNKKPSSGWEYGHIAVIQDVSPDGRSYTETSDIQRTRTDLPDKVYVPV